MTTTADLFRIEDTEERDAAFWSQMKSSDSPAQRMTLVAYGEGVKGNGALDYRVKCSSASDAADCIRLISQYNRFESDYVQHALFAHLSRKLYYNEGNPNNGRDMFSFEIGREASPVLYVTHLHYLHKWELCSLTGEVHAFTAEHFDAACKSFARDAHCDEVTSKSDNYSTTYRFWWD